ncbi:carboxylesterase/lipase family protein [Amycolatopsis sp. CA-128772]|uniref:carboxylesterase/lipase family protein n=1 Tax=Amycolatopsis sp. CA-128772 TaxID=2073159 RepID=UPI000CD08932|nr:carboxylesterase family protein [Amycolatopsis sp. CA-128772]
MTDRPRARTATGSVEGEVQDEVFAFRGIPFAAPPVGANRFAEPRPAAPWDGVRDVSAFGTAPPGPQAPTTGDDWLTLAVWTPDPGAARLPVLVWITGGAYLQCSTANPHFDGARLAAGGAVVVSVNYRVGAEGWAHLDGHPDNRGLLDQIAALRWVKDNIAAFGGDPGNVTVYGQSAGAGSCAALLVMPRAAGLIDRAILQSVPGTYFTPALAAAVTGHIRAEAGTAELADVAPPRLLAAVMAVSERMDPRWGPVVHTPTPFSPVVDGEILPVAPWAGLAAGAAKGVPLLLGHTRDDARMLAARLGPAEDAEVTALVAGLAPTVDADRYRAEFPGLNATALRELALGDWLLRMPTLRLAEAAQAGGSPVWLSELCWGYGPEGACHMLDASLVFGTTDLGGAVTGAGPEAVEQHGVLSELMRREYLAFAATGDPGWAAFEPPGRATRVYDVVSTVERYPEERSAAVWRDHRFGVVDPLGIDA